MYLIRLAIILTFVCLAVVSISAQVDESRKTEGEIVAWLKTSRCAGCINAFSTATTVEFWIVRINAEADAKTMTQEFILVQYRIMSRGLLDSELDSRLMLNLQTADKEETDCSGDVIYKKGKRYFRRPVTEADYVLTKNGKNADIKDFRSMPCFVVTDVPEVLDRPR
ncbi:MAG: hypothetical protein IPN69_05755 [Acidobacteria bacterium]|nr:hypothetical protein [Acidobacteriota bacterium]